MLQLWRTSLCQQMPNAQEDEEEAAGQACSELSQQAVPPPQGHLWIEEGKEGKEAESPSQALVDRRGKGRKGSTVTISGKKVVVGRLEKHAAH